MNNKLMPDLSESTEYLNETKESIKCSFGSVIDDPLKYFNTTYPINCIEIEKQETVKLGNNECISIVVRITVPGVSKLGWAQLDSNMYSSKDFNMQRLYDLAVLHAIEQFGITKTQEESPEDPKTKKETTAPKSVDIPQQSQFNQPGTSNQEAVVRNEVAPSVGGPNIPSEKYQGTPTGDPAINNKAGQQKSPYSDLDDDLSIKSSPEQKAPAQTTSQTQDQSTPVQTNVSPTQASTIKSVSPNPGGRDGSQWTKEQIVRMKEFKDKMNIVNNTILLSYVKSWNPTIDIITNMTCEQMDEFLNWTVNGSLEL